ncbi:MAG: glycine--tRNA ligase subunit beta [Alphaproteobacteria bacterium CG11_big_fil_rev_8_21_14_0_20_44_7]|nr:MAG: glycine--tRNA ligase subunit beta [Alphaproteobacteria bacterium CG11_big_fil_rev_8_21_14_0_20_44_7]
MTELLLELYSEEIPARMQELAARAFAESIDKDAEYFYSPHHIIVKADLPDKQQDENIERKGPKIGAPEQAINGFAKSCGVAGVDELEQREGYYFFAKQSKGENTKDYLAKKIPEILGGYSWPKSMRWGNHEIRWVRPLHSISCTFGGEVVPFKFGHLESAIISQPANINQTERKNLIAEGAKKLAGGVELDEKLLDEVTNLVENPVPMLGEFPTEFLQVPQECLVSSMKSHQKYFPVYDGQKLSSKFIFVANLEAEDGGKKIRAGNERVLKARLSDAKFFWEQDRKHKLEAFLPKLKQVTFHNKIGNMLEKAERISALAEFIAEKIGADAEKAKRAGLLCKADLVSEMVGEFAELQGIMGGYYADDKEIGEAIKLHYGEPKNNKLAIAVALADKFDSLVQLWLAGEKPTGSRDPFGLRRAALGIIRIILENNLKLNLREFAKNDEIFAFFIERLKYLLKSQEIRHDIVDAVLGQGDDLLIIHNKAQSLSEFLHSDRGTKLMECYNRAVNILTAEEKKDGISYESNPQEALLSSAEEKSLYEEMQQKEAIISEAIAGEDFGKAMGQLAQLQQNINAFFDNVMVNAENPQIRENRLKLLAKIRSFMDKIADFSKIEG